MAPLEITQNEGNEAINRGCLKYAVGKEQEHEEQDEYLMSTNRSSASTTVGVEQEDVDAVFGSSYQTEAWHVDDGEERPSLTISSISSPRSWSLSSSLKAQRTSNPIRNITDCLRPASHHGPDKPLLSLSLGDPTIYGNLPAPDVLINTIQNNLKEGKKNGYDNSAGSLEARKALASAYSFSENEAMLTEEVSWMGCVFVFVFVLTPPSPHVSFFSSGCHYH